MLTFSSSSPLVGDSSVIREIIETIKKISQTEGTVLISGEIGSGKERIARAIHESSNRAGRPFTIVNCGSQTIEQIETELFGSESQTGRLEASDGGTILLEEINALSVPTQIKLLRFLQTRQFESGATTKTADVRIIASSAVSLQEAVAQKQFREDLYDRLNVIPIRVPALRERKSDIPLLISFFMGKFNRLSGHSVEVPQGEVMDALLGYEWPGNVRELESLMERIVILKGKGTMELNDLPQNVFKNFVENSETAGAGAMADWDFPHLALPGNGLDLKAIVTAFENHLVDQALARTNGNKNRASELLKMNRTTLVEKLRKRGMIISIKGSREEGDEGTSTASNTTGET